MQPGASEYSVIQATYGVSPEQHSWPGTGVSPVEGYSGVFNAAYQFRNVLSALPQEDTITVVAHSHGGNVALLASMLLPSGRTIRNLVNLGTPVNWDLRDGMPAPKAAYLCQVSSTADWVQVVGSSPTQLGGLLGSAYLSIHYFNLANDYFLSGDVAMASYYMGLAVAGNLVSQWFLDSTREEWWGGTIVVGGWGHSDLHEPPVWQWVIPNACKLQ